MLILDVKVSLDFIAIDTPSSILCNGSIPFYFRKNKNLMPCIMPRHSFPLTDWAFLRISGCPFDARIAVKCVRLRRKGFFSLFIMPSGLL